MVSSNILQFTLALYISEKTGVKDNQNSNNFKDKRKNAKDNEINKLCSYKNDEDKKLCSQAKDNALRSYSVDTKDINLEILHFKQFYKRFVFDKDEEGYVKKTQKNYIDVRVVLKLL